MRIRTCCPYHQFRALLLEHDDQLWDFGVAYFQTSPSSETSAPQHSRRRLSSSCKARRHLFQDPKWLRFVARTTVRARNRDRNPDDRATGREFCLASAETCGHSPGSPPGPGPKSDHGIQSGSAGFVDQRLCVSWENGAGGRGCFFLGGASEHGWTDGIWWRDWRCRCCTDLQTRMHHKRQNTMAAPEWLPFYIISYCYM